MLNEGETDLSKPKAVHHCSAVAVLVLIIERFWFKRGGVLSLYSSSPGQLVFNHTALNPGAKKEGAQEIVEMEWKKDLMFPRP